MERRAEPLGRARLRLARTPAFCLRVYGCRIRGNALEHIVGKEELAVPGHHHHLDFVGKRSAMILLISKGDWFNSLASLLHAVSIGRRGNANTVRFRIRQQVAALELRLAIDNLGFPLGFRILDGGFFARLRFEPRLLESVSL